MKIDSLKERISKAEEKISKKQATIAKKQGWIEKRKANLAKLTTENDRYWETCEINHLEDDIMRLEREVKDAQESLEGYRAQLDREEEKAASRDVTVILEFLENWKREVMEYYAGKFDRFTVAYAEHIEADRKYTDWWNNGGFCAENRMKVMEERRKEDREFNKRWNGIFPYVIRRRNCETEQIEMVFDRERLQNELDHDANAKYDNIIERTNAICGKIVDARGLLVGNKGDLDGIVIGERGRAKVQTIGAGGYNIQCFHFRTLVHEWK